MKRHLQVTFPLLVMAAVGAPGAWSQTSPDAGTLLREQPKPNTTAPAAAKVRPPQGQKVSVVAEGPKVRVGGFRYIGNTLLSNQVLDRRLAEFIGQDLSLQQLKGLTAILSKAYEEHGYLARVVLPAQQVINGVVSLQIYEGKRGPLQLLKADSGLPVDWILQVMAARLGEQQTLDLGQLGEAVAVINEQAGVSAEVELLPEQGDSGVGIGITLKALPQWEGSLGLNNQAARGSGALQALGTISLNNLGGRLDALSVLATATAGSHFVRAEYSAPMGHAGWRFSINGSTLRYRITQQELNALGPRGHASTLGLTASYPMKRRTDGVVSFNAQLEHKSLSDQTSVGEVSRRNAVVANLGLNGWRVLGEDHWLGGGSSSFGVHLTAGEVRQHNAAALSADAVGRQVEGQYLKLAYYLAHLQRLSPDWIMNASLRGQFSSKNLDSTERFSLGGPFGVRAFPVGEATGDEGWLLSLSLQRAWSQQMLISLFLDAGGIVLNHAPYTNWNAGQPSLPNRYQLKSLGISLDWRIAPHAMLSTTLATPIGNNPGRDANDRNVDGRKRSMQLWLNLATQF